MPSDALKIAIDLADNASYDYFTKRAWRSKGTAVLRKLAKDLGLVKGTYDVRFNTGGDAVSGEAILHTDHIYICITSNTMYQNAGFARAVKSRMDYTGKQNIPIPKNYAGLLRIAQKLKAQGAVIHYIV